MVIRERFTPILLARVDGAGITVGTGNGVEYHVERERLPWSGAAAEARATGDTGASSTTDKVCAKPGMTCATPGMTCAKPGMTCAKPGMTCAKPGMTCAKPGMTCAKPGEAAGHSSDGTEGCAKAMTTRTREVV